MNNAHRIIEAVRMRGPLDDDELSMHTSILPRQQVNQICRRLQAKGVLSRELGPKGKIVNVLTLAHQCELPATPSIDRPKVLWPSKSNDPRDSPQHSVRVSDPRRALIVICCSKRKDNTPRPAAAKGQSIVDYLPEPLAERLRKARCEVARKAGLDESNLVPAWRRYTGHLYQAAGQTIERAVDEGTHVVIVSGAYGILLSDEPIGFYDRKFSRLDWPGGLLEEVLLAFVEFQNLKCIRAFASATSEYEKLLEQVRWRDARVDDAWLFVPEKSRAGRNSSRAQGEALVALLESELTAGWRSSDSLRLNAIRLA
jgi:hypothetical protein